MLAPVSEMFHIKEEIRKIFDSCEFRIQTNLVYELTDQKLEFLKSLDAVGTSWDTDLRFSSEVQLSLWLNNALKLINEGIPMTMTTCLSKGTLEKYKPKDIIGWAASLGFKYILFERISPTGNASINTHIIPKNEDLDNWFLDMYNQSVEEKFYDKIDNMFLSSIMSSFVTKNHQGCRTRSCEKNVITINADGTIGGCPDGAPSKSFGHINQEIAEIFNSDKRIENIACEMCRNETCHTCPVFDVCNGDCYQLKWDDRCAAPKKLMLQMKEENNIEVYKNFII